MSDRPETSLAGRHLLPHASVMFTVSEAKAAAIRAAFEQGGELSALVALRRLFPGVADNTEARECARTTPRGSRCRQTAAEPAARPRPAESPVGRFAFVSAQDRNDTRCAK
jgi:hypothetical protein